MTTISLDLNETAWSFACDKANATAEPAWTEGQANLPEKERTPFVPETWQAYTQRILETVEASYLAQAEEEEDRALVANARAARRANG